MLPAVGRCSGLPPKPSRPRRHDLRLVNTGGPSRRSNTKAVTKREERPAPEPFEGPVPNKDALAVPPTPASRGMSHGGWSSTRCARSSAAAAGVSLDLNTSASARHPPGPDTRTGARTHVISTASPPRNGVQHNNGSWFTAATADKSSWSSGRPCSCGRCPRPPTPP